MVLVVFFVLSIAFAQDNADAQNVQGADQQVQDVADPILAGQQAQQEGQSSQNDGQNAVNGNPNKTPPRNVNGNGRPARSNSATGNNARSVPPFVRPPGSNNRANNRYLSDSFLDSVRSVQSILGNFDFLLQSLTTIQNSGDVSETLNLFENLPPSFDDIQNSLITLQRTVLEARISARQAQQTATQAILGATNLPPTSSFADIQLLSQP